MRGNESAGLSRRTRFLAAIAGAGLLALLVTASRLTPDARGFGTHQQLGFPNCTFIVLFGQRCPTCGMTTAWSNVMHARPADAVRANAGGALLAVAAMALAPWALVVAARGKWLGCEPREKMIVAVAMAAVVFILAEWAMRLWSG